MAKPLRVRGLSLLVACAVPALAHAKCPSAGRPFVTLALSRADQDAEASRELLRAVQALLQAQLAPRGLQVCSPELGAEKARARVVFWVERSDPALLTSAEINVDDALSGKQVVRHVDLAGSTPGSVPLAVAVSIDELLRASWAEPPPPLSPPQLPPAPVRQPPSRGGRNKPALSVRLAALSQTDASSSVRFGGNGGLMLTLGRAGFLGLRGGYLSSLSRPAPHGRVLDWSVIGVFDAGLAVTSRAAPAGLEAGGWLSLARTSARGLPSGAALGVSTSFMWWGLGGELLGWVRLSAQLQLFSSVAAGFPLPKADALDGEERLPLLAAPLLFGQLGLRWKL